MFVEGGTVTQCGPTAEGEVVRAAKRAISFTPSRPSHKNDRAIIATTSNRLVRKDAFHRRYVTADEVRVLNRLWQLVHDRKHS